MLDWITAKPTDVVMTVASSVIVYAWILVLTRLAGLRSFSKMSAADFAMTVAVGSLFASAISSPSPSIIVAGVAFTSLFLGQWVVASLRQRSPSFSRSLDNEPLLLMAGQELLHDNLKRAQITKKDVYAKLREANVRNFDEVFAVVFETTGDVSVLHGSDDVHFDTRLLLGVNDAERAKQESPSG